MCRYYFCLRVYSWKTYCEKHVNLWLHIHEQWCMCAGSSNILNVVKYFIFATEKSDPFKFNISRTITRIEKII